MGKSKRNKNNKSNKNIKKAPIGSFSVTPVGSNEKQLISLFADLDLDEKGEFEVNDGKHDSGMFFNILKTDFEKMEEFKYMHLVRYKDKPELLLKEDYKYYFEESLKSINACDMDDDEVAILKDSFYKLLAIVINITKLKGFTYYAQYEFLTNLIDTPDGDLFAPELDEEGYYDLSELIEDMD